MAPVNTIGLLNLHYPVFSSTFDGDGKLLVAGGGGEGKNGIKNKISLINIDPASNSDHLEVSAEIELPINEDNPTSLAVVDNKIYAGVNRSTAQIKQQDNDHLRVFEYKKDGILETSSHSIFANQQLDDYQKATAVSQDGSKLALLSSAVKGIVYVLKQSDPAKVQVTVSSPSRPSQKSEINDISFSPDKGSFLAFCTSHALHIADSETGEILLTIDTPHESLSFAKLSFVDDGSIVAVLNTKNRKGFWLYQFQLDWKQNETDTNDDANDDADDTNNTTDGNQSPAYSVSNFRQLARKGSAVAFDSGPLYTAVASSDFTIYITNTSKMGSVKSIAQAHTFAITSLALSEDESLLASTSVDNTVRVLALPEDGRLSATASVPQTVIVAIISAFIVIAMALILERVIQKQVISDLISSSQSPSSVPDDFFSSPVETSLDKISPVSTESMYATGQPEALQQATPEPVEAVEPDVVEQAEIQPPTPKPAEQPIPDELDETSTPSHDEI